MDDVSSLVELDDRRRLLAAFTGWRVLIGCGLEGVG